MGKDDLKRISILTTIAIFGVGAMASVVGLAWRGGIRTASVEMGLANVVTKVDDNKTEMVDRTDKNAKAIEDNKKAISEGRLREVRNENRFEKILLHMENQTTKTDSLVSTVDKIQTNNQNMQIEVAKIKASVDNLQRSPKKE
ncbi:unnamed protein product [marine sediment metagenome]|uniref:Uncharacterized protein n=1 Tax=marine sediment metagenome TaxID=412755 RepID=X0XIM6_9ZZZZ